MFSKILVPLDGSALSEQALPTAMALAEAGKAELILLRGVSPIYLSLPVVTQGFDLERLAASPEESRTEAWQYLHDIETHWHRPGVQMSVVLIDGDAASVIVDTAVVENVDLIIMSSHGWSGRSRWSLGGVTERVLQDVPCPILVMRKPDSIRHVMIPLDGSDLAALSLEPGVGVADLLGASVTLFRANEPLVWDQTGTVDFDWEQSEAGRRWRDYAHEEATFYLEDITLDIEVDDIEVATAVVDGPNVDSILNFAADNDVQLIVMTTHGRSGLRRWLYGSVTANVLRQYDNSMLIIRPGATEVLDD